MATLNTNVHVTDDSGVSHVFGPADEVPTWAQELITNPKAWSEPPSASRLAEPVPEPAKKSAPRRAGTRRKAEGDGAGNSG